MDRSSPPLPTRDMREHVLSLLKKVVLEIQSTDKQLTDLVIPQNIYDLCRRFVEEKIFEYRYENPQVFEILQQDYKELIASEAEVNKMKNGLKSLLRYPLNLLVAPNRPELKIIKASTSFFMFQVKRNLKDARAFLGLMGYDQARNATDLSLNKSFSIDRVYTLVLDIVILHEELEIISFLISQSMEYDIKFYHYFIARRYGPSNRWDCLDYIMKGEAARQASYLEQPPHPSSGYSLTTTGRGQGYREHSTGQSYHNNDYRDYRDERYDNPDYRYRHDDRGPSQGYYREGEQRSYYPYGNESDQYHRDQYQDDQYQYQSQYHQNQHDQDHQSRYQYQDDRYQHQDDPHFRDQRYDYNDQQRHIYNKDERYHQHEDKEQSKRREVECDGGQRPTDTTIPVCTSPLDSVSGMPPPMFSVGQMMNLFKNQSTPKKEVASDDQQPHSLNHTDSRSDSFDEQHGFNFGRRYSSTPSFRPDSSYTDKMYCPFEEQPVSVKFTIDEETESERNEDEISSSSPPHLNQSGRLIKSRRNNSLLAGAGSTDSPHTWSGTNAVREVLRKISKDDSVLVMAEGHRTGSYNCWTCTFCSNENFGGIICDACNQERANLHSY